MPVELTETQFEVFKEEAGKWLEFFGLKDWEIRFSFEHNDDFDRARCYTNWLGRICTLELARWQSEERSDEEIRKVAFHEVCELLLAEMENISMDEEVPYSERKGLLETSRHGVIRRLENSVFKQSIHG